MKKRILKNTFIAASLLLAAGYGEMAFAHDLEGDLGTAAGTTDLYQITCGYYGASPSARLLTSVSAGAVPGSTLYPAIPLGVRVSVRAQRLAKATNSTDIKNNDGIGSRFASTYAGDGVYYVTVGKTSATSVPVHYHLDYHCYTSSNEHAETSATSLQNQ